VLADALGKYTNIYYSRIEVKLKRGKNYINGLGLVIFNQTYLIFKLNAFHPGQNNSEYILFQIILSSVREGFRTNIHYFGEIFAEGLVGCFFKPFGTFLFLPKKTLKSSRVGIALTRLYVKYSAKLTS